LTHTNAEEPTLRDPTREATLEPTGASRHGPTLSATLVSPLQALHMEEIRRIRVFTGLAIGFAALVALALPFTRLDPVTLAVMLSGFVVFFPAAWWLNRSLVDARTLPLGAVLVFGFASLYAGTTGIYYFGIFSPAVAANAFGIFFFSPSTSFRAALAIYLGGALMHAALAVAILSGAALDRGLVQAGDLGLGEALLTQGLVQVVLFASFAIGRATRRAKLAAIEAHDEAVQELAQREGLLKEARLELSEARALGRLGHYSDQKLGSYVLGEVIGRGAMGEVYEAMHIATGDVAAVKLLHRQVLGDPSTVRRFMREAKLTSRVQSPHVCRVLEIGGLDAPIPYLAMELLRGEDLASLLRRRRRLPLREVVKLVTQIGEGLDAAHAAGILHRDINPKNLFSVEAGAGRQWKIVDFGVAQAADDEGATGSDRDRIAGTPAYMAPELALGREATERADLFSLALVAYRALTGQAAFSGASVPDTLLKVAREMPPSPSELVRVPAAIDSVMAIALAKNPNHRFGSGRELARALERAARGKVDPALAVRAGALLAAAPWRTRVA
jgi:eukaryotic-like serine/threonine-protein kinase